MINEELYNKLQFIQEAIERKNKKENSKNITRGQGRIIAILQIKESISTSELATILGIRKASLNETLKKLEKNKYIYKEPSKKDKRIQLIKLTEKGKNYKFKKTKTTIFNKLTEEEKENLNEYLNKIIRQIREELIKENPEEFKKEYELRKKIFKEKFNIESECENQLLEILRQCKK